MPPGVRRVVKASKSMDRGLLGRSTELRAREADPALSHLSWPLRLPPKPGCSEVKNRRVRALKVCIAAKVVNRRERSTQSPTLFQLL